ncbi:MAG: DNA repair protein RecO [Myxococcales bacterium]|nr:DNA repair protein RecO [Myxococcales bacterium]MCB9732212.1 DNA repair protein RecO [Deltaproteobacteria bacterium]
MSEPWSGQALVLSSADAQSHRIVRLLTADDRVVAAIAREARRGPKRFGARVQPLSLSHVTYALRPSDDLAKLGDAALEEPFPTVKGDLVRLALATTMADVVLTTVPDFAREEGLFELLLRAWRFLDRGDARPVEETLLLFELRFLVLSGLLAPDELELPNVPNGARDVVAGWLAGQWRPLADADRPLVAAALEGLLVAATGRALKSRPFLDEVLGRRPPA